MNQEFVQGDGLRLRAIGSTLEAWRYDNNAGAWTKLGQTSDATYVGIGYVGLGMRGTGGRLDDFGAATLRSPSPYTDDVIDDFNRSDENPLSDGGKYSVLSSNLEVVSNQVACTIAATCSMWRTDVRYGADQEAWVTIEAKPINGDRLRLYARLQEPTQFDGYALYLQSNAGVDQVGIERWDNGAVTPLGSPMNQEFVQGDKLRLRAIGSTLEAWRYDNNAGSWSKLGERTDSTYLLDGYLGFGIRGTGGRLDDFGGGGTSPTFDTHALLLSFTPQLRFRSDETYRPSKASLATDTYSTDEPVHANHLDLLGETIASANHDDEELDLSLDFVSTLASEEGAEDTYINEPDFMVNGMHADEIITAPIDYNMMLTEHPGEYENFTYARAIPDPQGSGDFILQYWFYYYYNQWQFAGGGDHEGDWEWIQIRIDEAGVPISAAFGQHGAGEWCDWDDVETDGEGTLVVWPAFGSHANYFHSGTYGVDEVPGPFDGEDATAAAAGYLQDDLTVIDQTSAQEWGDWLTWPGRWGASGSWGADSPESPGHQTPWENPFSWHENADHDGESCNP
jgi:hypothetical protein